MVFLKTCDHIILLLLLAVKYIALVLVGVSEVWKFCAEENSRLHEFYDAQWFFVNPSSRFITVFCLKNRWKKIEVVLNWKFFQFPKPLDVPVPVLVLVREITSSQSLTLWLFLGVVRTDVGTIAVSSYYDLICHNWTVLPTPLIVSDSSFLWWEVWNKIYTI